MKKTIKVVNVPKESTRHYIGNFGLVEIKEDLPQEICQAGYNAGLVYFEEVDTEKLKSQGKIAIQSIEEQKSQNPDKK